MRRAPPETRFTGPLMRFATPKRRSDIEATRFADRRPRCAGPEERSTVDRLKTCNSKGAIRNSKNAIRNSSEDAIRNSKGAIRNSTGTDWQIEATDSRRVFRVYQAKTLRR